MGAFFAFWGLSMPRQRPIYSPDFPYHITARCHNKQWFDLPMETVWEVMSNYLFFIHEAYKVEIHAFVLMHNHFHLIIRFPENNMSEAMNYFMRETSRMLSRSAGRINQTYGSRYFRSAISKNHYYEHVYKYLYRNPVEAKLCQRVEEYPYSTLQIRLGQRKGVIPLVEDPRLEQSLESTLSWLNAKPKEKDREEIRKGLKKSQFELPTRGAGNFIHRLEVDTF